MFASQLLRVLQSLPADVKYEPCDTAELKLRMKENQNVPQRHSDGYCKEPDSLSLTTKDFSHSNGIAKDVDPLVLQAREGDDSWNKPDLKCSAVIDDLTKDTKTDIRVSLKEDRNGHLYHLSGCNRDADPIGYDRKDRDKSWNTPELECSMISNDFSVSNKNETRDSGAPFITSSDLFPSDAHMCTDKNVMDCELPELIVCYKEINYHVVKDICIDEGVPDERKGVTDLHMDHCAAVCVSQLSKENRQNAASGGLDFALLNPDGSKASSEEDIDDPAADKHWTNEEGDVVSHVPGKLNCSEEGGISKDGRSPKDFTQACETKCTPNKMKNGVPEEESIITSMLPLKKFGTRSFLRSFMDTLNNDKDEVAKPPNQSLPLEANLESLIAVSKDESNKNDPASKLAYDRKVENGTITFDFNSCKPAATDSWGRSVETIEQSLKLDEALNQSDGNIDKTIATDLIQHVGLDAITVNMNKQSALANKDTNNPFIVSEVQSTSKDGSTENIREETVLNHKKGNSNNPFAVGEVQTIIIDERTVNINQIPRLNHEKGKFNAFTFGEIETASMNTSTEGIQLPPVSSAQKGNSDNPFAVSEVQNEQPMLNHEIGKTTNPFAVCEVQSSSMAGDTESIHQQPELEYKNSTSNNPFAIKEVQKDGTDKCLFISNHVQSASTMTKKSEILHEKSFEPQALPNHEPAANNISFTDQGQCVEGEASFSAGAVSGRITYSGPITQSGSTSLRSDSSTTSTRSFAFPVLQPEWNSSPVRMAKADGRHFRKHRGWKQGILCCRF